MSLFKEFKKFAVKGNVIDMAVGIIIGTAFGKVVNSLVSDIIMPPISFLLDRVDLSKLYFVFSDIEYTNLVEAQTSGAFIITYGIFLDALLNFVIIAFAVFILVKQVNRIQESVIGKEESKTFKCPFCISMISKKATRCPNCTSEIPQEKEKKSSSSKEKSLPQGKK